MLALVLLAAVPPSLGEAMAKAAPPGVRVEVESWSAPACAATRFEAMPVEGSGRVAVRALGPGCAVWGWASVRLFSTQLVVERPIGAGEPLEGAVRIEERTWTKGMGEAPSLTGAVASRSLSAGAVVREADVRFGPAPGTPISVRLQFNAISIEQRGNVIACGRQQVCAVLTTGKRVTGTMRDGVLIASLGGTR